MEIFKRDTAADSSGTAFDVHNYEFVVRRYQNNKRFSDELVFVLAVPLKLINCKSSNFNLEGRSPLINRLKPVSGAAGVRIKYLERRTVAQGLFERDGPGSLHRQVSRFG